VLQRRLVLLLAGLVTVALALPVASAGALTRHQVFGISNITDRDLNSKYLKRLKPKATREIADWDVARHAGPARDRVDVWYQSAIKHHLQPLLSFGGFKRHKAPTVHGYSKGVKAAIRRWPRIHQWQAWNEANNRTQPIVNHHPARAARYAKALDKAVRHYRKHRHDKTLPVTIVLSYSRYTHNWLNAFVRAYGKTPKIWAIHGYSDANRFSYRRMRAFTSWFPKGKIWITETGALAYYKNGFKYSLHRQKKAVKLVFGQAMKWRSRVQRLYWWQWRGSKRPYPKGVYWDSGLMYSSGHPRPAYKAVKYWRFHK
jgi:hypothetical protein